MQEISTIFWLPNIPKGSQTLLTKDSDCISKHDVLNLWLFIYDISESQLVMNVRPSGLGKQF